MSGVEEKMAPQAMDGQAAEASTLSQPLPERERSESPRLLAFLCNWCSYAGADLAGGGRLQYPSNVRILRVPCSARVDPALVLRAFRLGFDGVLVAGCHPGDCHYSKGNFYTRRRMAIFKPFLNYLGIHPKRFRLEWVSASEGHRFAEVIREMVGELEELKQQGQLPERTSSQVSP